MKRLGIVIFTLLCILALSAGASAADARVESMEVDLSVDENGTARVDASLHVVLDESVESFSLGLGPDVSGVQVSGVSARVKRMDGQRVVVVSGENGLPSALDLQLAYTIRNTVQSDGDAQIFTVRLLGGIKEASIDKLSVRVKMPAPFETMPEFTSGYYADGIDNYLDIQISEQGLLTAISTEPLLAGETLDLKLSTPSGYFTLHNVAGRTLLVDQILMVLLVLLGVAYWWRSLRSAWAGVSAQSRPPMGVEPGVTALLMTGQNPDLALMAMNWAASGYLRVVRLRGQKVMLIRQMPMGNERSVYEQELFARLFDKNPEVQCGKRFWHSVQKKANKAARDYWNNRLYERNAGRPGLLRGISVLFCAVAALYYGDLVLPGMSLRILFLAAISLAGLCWGIVLQSALRRLPGRRRKGPILCILVCLALIAIAWYLTGHGTVLLIALLVTVLTEAALVFGPKRKQSGAALLSELLGWRRYLRKLTPADAKVLLEADPQYFYQNLIYAEAFGIGRRFTRAFDGLKLDECAFLERETKPLPRNAGQFRTIFTSTLAIARDETKHKRLGARKQPAAAGARRR